MAMVRYPLPLTAAMLAKANATHEGKPRYSTGADWSGGASGNEEDVATATSSIVDQNGVAWGPYAPKTQTAKAAVMVPPLQILDDLGIDYGTYAGQAGRTGPVTPLAPYPDGTSPPIVTGVSPATGLAAGGTAITITGAGFTGATAVTVGGTAATAVVVVNSNTITATTPAKAAGTYDVRVTTPKGTSAIGGASDNFVYT
jgi:hypothetical protein